MNKIKLLFGFAALVCVIAFSSCGETANNVTEKAKNAAAATTNAAKGAATTVANGATNAVTTTGAAVAGAAATVAKGATNVVDGAKDAAKAVVGKNGPEYISAYVCPMHCKGSGSDKAGTCPTCEMDYVANAHAGHSH